MTGGMTGLYGRALLRQLPVVGASGDALPDAVEELEAAEIERDALREYDEVCGFRLTDVAPPTYLHILAFPLAMRLMTRGDFPFKVMGLVHVENRIEQRRAVRAGEHVDVRVHATDLRDHERGRQFDVVSEAFADGVSIWLEHSTYLRRGAGGGGSGSGSSKGSSGSKRSTEPPRTGAVWRIPDDAGRRYAAVSGDRNPIHLRGLTAKAFGQPGAIAHGMWLAARCLAALEGRVPEAHVNEVRFKLPVPLGSTVAFTSRATDEGRDFALASAKDGRPHLAGTVRPG